MLVLKYSGVESTLKTNCGVNNYNLPNYYWCPQNTT